LRKKILRRRPSRKKRGKVSLRKLKGLNLSQERGEKVLPGGFGSERPLPGERSPQIGGGKRSSNEKIRAYRQGTTLGKVSKP